MLRSLDGADAHAEIEVSLARAQVLPEKSGARAFAPFIVEERARLCEVLGDEKGAARHLRADQSPSGDPGVNNLLSHDTSAVVSEL